MIKPKPTLRRRVMITSVIILVIISSAMAGVIYQLFRQSHINAFSNDLINQAPLFIAQMHQAGLVSDLDTWIDSVDTSDPKYSSALCKDQETIWASADIKEEVKPLFCNRTNDIADGSHLIETHEGEFVLAYIATLVPPNGRAPNLTYKDHRIVVVRPASSYIEQRAEVEKNTLFSLSGFIVLSVLALFLAFHWSFKPLNQLAKELDDITDGEQNDLKARYPVELEPITIALNRMIYLSKEQGQRYQHAMDDLAHSLKSRIAATHAIMDEPEQSKTEMVQRIGEQTAQMNELVQYQLKRATLGQQGLTKESTPLSESIVGLERMLSKIYMDKHIKLTHRYASDATLPLNKNDMMELLGNLMENAYRFALSEVRVSTHVTNKTITVKIEDDGPGVDEAHREAIFQRGVRADQLNPGQGIGLAVCHEIVSIYQGKIWVETADIEGAAFVIELPLS
ncbi:ATP-binding protein [Thaumasiovibrio subtropicus]|uniref:ATP-binding protein n=1 Tax=Thaumasiovibrio subtropicus TaxID=1891207 RepID=UPI000B34C8DB|nr:ATP-binding protein [Thaumasiovibrio subtropicus]